MNGDMVSGGRQAGGMLFLPLKGRQMEGGRLSSGSDLLCGMVWPATILAPPCTVPGILFQLLFP